MFIHIFEIVLCSQLLSHSVSSVDPKPEVFPRDFQQAVGWVYILVRNAAN